MSARYCGFTWIAGALLALIADTAHAVYCAPPSPYPVPPFPWAPSLVVSSGLTASGAKDRIRIIVWDAFPGRTTPAPAAQPPRVTQSGTTIAISAELLDPCVLTNPEGPFEVDLGFLPSARYTVSYSSGTAPSGSNLVLKFLVSDSGATTAWPSVPAIEFFNSGLDRYFVTAEPFEIAALDNGTIGGWSRTGEQFPVWPADGMAGNAFPVCRLYGLPYAGLDTHFYSIDADECAAVMMRWGESWYFEQAAAFGAAYPSGGNETGVLVFFCETGGPALYRLYSNAPGSDHRYTTSVEIRDSMVGKGWILEGAFPGEDGLPFAMCLPPANP